MYLQYINCKLNLKIFTFTLAAEAALEASNARFSTVRSSLIPSAFAKILTPLSLVETANSIPSLLNLIHGEACRFQRHVLLYNEVIITIIIIRKQNKMPNQ